MLKVILDTGDRNVNKSTFTITIYPKLLFNMVRCTKNQLHSKGRNVNRAIRNLFTTLDKQDKQ